MTQEGSIVGTLQYMAPEQLQGKPTEVRADIFSFGCVLYEMLTGERAFDGANAASVIAAIMQREAPSVAEVAPATLDWALRRCLAKDPDERWQTAHDLKAELVWIAGGGTEAPRKTQARSASKWIWGAAVLLIAAITALAGWMLRPVPAASKPVSRMVIALGPGEHLANLDTPAVAISPDGTNASYMSPAAAAVPLSSSCALWTH